LYLFFTETRKILIIGGRNRETSCIAYDAQTQARSQLPVITL